VNAAPMCNITVVTKGNSSPNGPLAGHLITIIQIVDSMKDRIVIGNFNDSAVGKNPFHALVENTPVDSSPEVIAHEETAAQQVLAYSLGLGIRQIPLAHEHRIKPGIVEDVVFVLNIDRLFYRSHLESRPAPHSLKKMPVRARIIVRPTRVSCSPIPTCVTETRIGNGRIHQARKDPLGLLVVVRWQRNL